MANMLVLESNPEIGLVHLGPDVDDPLLRARQLSNFMRREVHGPVYEDVYGLPRIDPDPPSGTDGDLPWRIEAMHQNNVVQPDGTYREYVIAGRLNDNGEISSDLTAIVGLVVLLKPNGLCTPGNHRPSHIAEIDVAQEMLGTGLALNLLDTLNETHPEDPYIDMETYEGNERSRRFHGKLGFVIDEATPPRAGEVYEGQWVRMVTESSTFHQRLDSHLGRA